MSAQDLRKRAASRAIEALLGSVSRAARWHPEARALRAGVECIPDLPYVPGSGPEHRLDIYRPVGMGRRPVMLYLHGGGFSILSKDSHWMFGYGFAQRGFLVISINYRLAPVHPFPAALEDAAAALQWAVNNAAAFGGDASQLVLAGESAGANLALSLMIACCWPREEAYARRLWDRNIRPRAVMPACGFLQVSQPERYEQREDLPPIIRTRIAAICSAYLPDPQPGSHDLADPLLVLEGDSAPRRPLPPILAQCGGDDPVVDDTIRLGRALERHGLPDPARIYAGCGHAFHALFWREDARQAWGDAERFLHRLGLMGRASSGNRRPAHPTG